MKIQTSPIESLTPYARNSRTHSDEQVAQIAASLVEFGWTNPVLADDKGIVAGHGRVLAARKLYDAGRRIALPSGDLLPAGTVPVIDCTGWPDTKRRAYVIADNKLAMNSGWDEEMLKVELQDLADTGLDVGLTGFSPEEINVLFNGWQSDIGVLDKHGENTDGIGGVIKVKVSKADEDMAREAITSALDAAGVGYEFA